MAIENEHWVISGEADTATPEIGATYEVVDSRKGTYTGRVLEVRGVFVVMERLRGNIHWASAENRFLVGSTPDEVSSRAGLCTLKRIQ